MGEMEQLRKEADSLKDQITVSRPVHVIFDKLRKQFGCLQYLSFTLCGFAFLYGLTCFPLPKYLYIIHKHILDGSWQ